VAFRLRIPLAALPPERTPESYERHRDAHGNFAKAAR
jgi:hypothetical protein